MKSVVSLGLTATIAPFALAQHTTHKFTYHSKLKRDFLTCEQTYGGGSITCGPVDSHYCYDPTLGETCCALDMGFCSQGDFCAPVPGFCCHNTESPGVCAARLGFSLPPSFKSASASATATATEVLPDAEISATTIAIALGVIPAPTSTADPEMELVYSTTHGTMVPEQTAPVDIEDTAATSASASPSESPIEAFSANANASPISTSTALSMPTYLAASGAVTVRTACFGTLVAVIGTVIWVL